MLFLPIHSCLDCAPGDKVIKLWERAETAVLLGGKFLGFLLCNRKKGGDTDEEAFLAEMIHAQLAVRRYTVSRTFVTYCLYQ